MQPIHSTSPLFRGVNTLISRWVDPQSPLAHTISNLETRLIASPLAPVLTELHTRLIRRLGPLRPRLDRGLWQLTGTGNPLLDANGVPRFDEIRPEHIVPAVTQIDRDTREDFADLEGVLALIKNPTWEDLIPPLNEIERKLNNVWRPVSHLLIHMLSPEIEQAHEEAQKIIVALSLHMGQSKTIYRTLTAIREGVEWFRLDEGQRRTIDSLLSAARLSGVGLEGAALTRFNEITNRLAELSTRFSSHDVKSTEAFKLVIRDKGELRGLTAQDLEGLAAAYNHEQGKNAGSSPGQATPENGPWLITLEHSNYSRVMKRAEDSALRERLYNAMTTVASTGEFDNGPLITEILRLQRELSQILGFKTYADLSLSQKMAERVEAAKSLITRLHDKAKPKALDEAKALEEFAGQKGHQGPIHPWDITYYTEMMRKELFAVDEGIVKQYFALPHVMTGVFALVKDLFGVEIRPADGKVPVYHEDVRYFEVFSEESQIAAFYFDPYERAGQKKDGAWMNEMVNRHPRTDGTFSLPVATLTTNFEKPTGSKPSPMTMADVETLVHELGHALQHMLTTVLHEDVAGISNVEWDAVEIASQFMEFWVYQPDILKKLSTHVETGEPMPDALINKIRQARNFFAANATLNQLLYAAIDLELYHRYDPENPSESVYDVHQRIARQIAVYQPPANNRFLNTFGHIFSGGYAAGYYSYKWAEVMAADLFSAFEPHLDDPVAIRAIGQRLRETLYSLGGSVHPGEVFRRFMGRDYSVDALLKLSGL